MSRVSNIALINVIRGFFTALFAKVCSWSRRGSLNIKPTQPASGHSYVHAITRRLFTLSSSCSWELNFSIIFLLIVVWKKWDAPIKKLLPILLSCEWTLETRCVTLSLRYDVVFKLNMSLVESNWLQVLYFRGSILNISTSLFFNFILYTPLQR